MAAIADDARRAAAVAKYRASFLKSRELESLLSTGRDDLKKVKKDFKKTEEHAKVFQSTNLIMGEVLRPLDNKRFIVKANTGRRYLVNCRSKMSVEYMTTSTRVCLDHPTSLTIMHILPREVDPLVFNMIREDPGDVIFSAVEGHQIRELKETIELPIMNPELFTRVGIKPPKTLLARALASGVQRRRHAQRVQGGRHGGDPGRA